MNRKLELNISEDTSNTCILWFHKWSKWERKDINVNYFDDYGRFQFKGTDTRQYRECQKCGLGKYRKVFD